MTFKSTDSSFSPQRVGGCSLCTKEQPTFKKIMSSASLTALVRKQESKIALLQAPRSPPDDFDVPCLDGQSSTGQLPAPPNPPPMCTDLFKDLHSQSTSPVSIACGLLDSHEGTTERHSIRAGSQAPTPATHLGHSRLAHAGNPTEQQPVARLPMFDTEGRLVGYRQNSKLMLRPMAASSCSALLFSEITEPKRSVSQREMLSADVCGDDNCPVALHLHTHDEASEFSFYAHLPHRGFPDAVNSVPGYILGPVLGKGGFCTVRKALHESTGETVAVKIIEKMRLKDPKDRDRVDRECRVLRNVSNHVAIVRVLQCVETPSALYLVMEHCGGGSLLDHVRTQKRLEEEEASLLLQQLLHALQFCHARDIVHRDVKLENILLDGEGGGRLIDFGLCGYYAPGKRLRCHCGSPSYAAPEIVARKDYMAPPVDVWSLGVVLFAMLAGYLPFHAKEKKHLSEKILIGKFKIPSWVSTAAADLLQRMLTVDPAERITLADVWAHPWITGSPRWEPPGVGPGGLLRSEVDPITGAPIPDETVMAQLVRLGYDRAATWRSLRLRAADELTTAYHLLADARVRTARRQGTIMDSSASCCTKQQSADIVMLENNNPIQKYEKLIRAVHQSHGASDLCEGAQGATNTVVS